MNLYINVFSEGKWIGYVNHDCEFTSCEGWRYESPISANIEMMAKVYQTKHPEHTLKVGNVYNRITA